MLENLKIHLLATGVETNTQTVTINCCACHHHQLESIRCILLENRKLLIQLREILQPELVEQKPFKLVANGN